MKSTTLITLVLIILSCSSSQKAVKDEKCPKIYKNSFTKILNEKQKTVLNNDTISFNEIQLRKVSDFAEHKKHKMKCKL